MTDRFDSQQMSKEWVNPRTWAFHGDCSRLSSIHMPGFVVRLDENSVRMILNPRCYRYPIGVETAIGGIWRVGCWSLWEELKKNTPMWDNSHYHLSYSWEGFVFGISTLLARPASMGVLKLVQELTLSSSGTAFLIAGKLRHRRLFRSAAK